MFHAAELHRDISQATYHAWPVNQQLQRGAPEWVLSRSELLQLDDCGEMFLAGGREVSGKSVSTGSLVDCLLTSPGEFDSTYAVQPATYSKETTKGRGDKKQTVVEEKPWTNQSNTCRAWAQEQRDAGRIVISQKEFREAQDIALAVRHKRPDPAREVTLGQLIEACETQLVVTATWRDELTGRDIPMRAMLDLARGLDGEQIPKAYDLKTAAEVSPRELGYSIRKWGYDVQAWMYSSMLAAALDYEGDLQFGLLTVRNSAPYLVATYYAKPDTMRQGRERFERCIRTYCDGLDNGFAGYTRGFEPI